MARHEPDDPDAQGPAATSHVLVAVAVGGALGSAGRWWVSEEVPTAGGFPWPTLLVNVTGALLLGMLVVAVTVAVAERPGVWPLLEPLLGVGLLGGWTTFSTYALEARDLLATGEPVLAVTYVAGSVVAGLAAAWLGLAVTRRLTAGATP